MESGGIVLIIDGALTRCDGGHHFNMRLPSIRPSHATAIIGR